MDQAKAEFNRRSEKITNNEPKNTLYIFKQENQNNKNIASRQKNPKTAQTKQLQPYIDKTTKNSTISPIKRLVKRFKKSGLNAIESRFNARFFYFQWKSDKEGRKPQKYLKTIAKHPRGWSKYNTAGEVYEKNEYDRYLDSLTVIARIYGFVCSAFSPLRSLAKKTKIFLNDLKNPAKTAKNIRYLIKRTCGVFIPAGSVVFTAAMILNVLSFTPTFEITFENQNLGFVDSKQTVGKIISAIERNVSSVLGEEYEFSGKLNYKIVLSQNSSRISEKELYSILYNSQYTQGAITEAYGLHIDGDFIIAAESEDDIKQALEEVLETKTNAEEGEIVEYAHDIQIIPGNYAVRDIVTQDELKTIINFSTEPDGEIFNGALFFNELNELNDPEKTEIADEIVPLAKITEDKENETEIGGEDAVAMAAVSFLSLTSEQISGSIPRGFLNAAANAGDENQSYILSRMSKTSASVAPNLFQFKKIKNETYETETPFETKYINSDKYYTGTQTIQTKGRNGESLVTAEVTYINENEISRDIIETEVIKEPVTQVVIVGTKAKPASGPTGNFKKPLYGAMSTRFSGGHRGIDIPAPSGTPVYAADGGTVIYAGFSGSYGNHVKIRHSNGFVTLYAHFSSISVKYGEQVFQGQEIGKVGSTGRSTGNHLHFEIIKNGVQVNPEAYLP